MARTGRSRKRPSHGPGSVVGKRTLHRKDDAYAPVDATRVRARSRSPPSRPRAPARRRQPTPAETPATPAASPEVKTSGGLFALEEVERQLRAQREEIEQLRAAVKEQSRLINDLRSRVEDTERLAAGRPAGAAAVRDAAYSAAAGATPDGPQSAAAAGAGGKQGEGLEARVARVEEQAKKTADSGLEAARLDDLLRRHALPLRVVLRAAERARVERTTRPRSATRSRRASACACARASACAAASATSSTGACASRRAPSTT